VKSDSSVATISPLVIPASSGPGQAVNFSAIPAARFGTSEGYADHR
jgi:hypothetical protein